MRDGQRGTCILKPTGHGKRIPILASNKSNTLHQNMSNTHGGISEMSVRLSPSIRVVSTRVHPWPKSPQSPGYRKEATLSRIICFYGDNLITPVSSHLDNTIYQNVLCNAARTHWETRKPYAIPARNSPSMTTVSP